MGERYLVTGGAGFIGSAVVDELLLRGHEVRVLDNFSTGRRENLAHLGGEIEVVEGDIRSQEGVRVAVRGIDYVVHEAAITSVPQSVADPQTAHEVNATGTLNLLLAARDEGVGRVVFASSCAVYGDAGALPKEETFAASPVSPYAVAKLAGEQYCFVVLSPLRSRDRGTALLQRLRAASGSTLRVQCGHPRVPAAGSRRPRSGGLRRRPADPRLHLRRRRRAGNV